MFSKRMFTSVWISDKKWINVVYSLCVIGLVVIFTEWGGELGNLAVLSLLTLLGPEVIQVIMFTLDPIFVTLLGFAVISFLVLAWVRWVEKRPIVGLGFFKEGAGLAFGKGVLIGFALMGSVVALLILTGSIHLSNLSFTKENILNLLLIFPFWVLQSGTEELATRGWLLPVLSRRVSLPIGVAVSSFLFAALHMNNPSVSWIALANIALFGLFACLYVLKTDTLWGIAAIHASWNYFQGSFFGLPVSGLSVSYAPMAFSISDGPDWLTGGQFGPEGSILASLVLLAGIAWLAISLKKDTKEEFSMSDAKVLQTDNL